MWRPGVGGAGARDRRPSSRSRSSCRSPALQTFRDWDVVFIRIGDTYEVRPLELGRRDGEPGRSARRACAPGDAVVVEQSYLIKADIEKSGASHDH